MGIEAIRIQNLQGTQAISIPESFKINDDKVYIKKIGNVIYLIPFHNHLIKRDTIEEYMIGQPGRIHV